MPLHCVYFSPSYPQSPHVIPSSAVRDPLWHARNLAQLIRSSNHYCVLKKKLKKIHFCWLLLILKGKYATSNGPE